MTEFWRAPLIGGCVDFGCLHSANNRFFSHDGQEKPADYNSRTNALKAQTEFNILLPILGKQPELRVYFLSS